MARIRSCRGTTSWQKEEAADGGGSGRGGRRCDGEGGVAPLSKSRDLTWQVGKILPSSDPPNYSDILSGVSFWHVFGFVCAQTDLELAVGFGSLRAQIEVELALHGLSWSSRWVRACPH